MRWIFLTDNPKLPKDRAEVLACDAERRVFACRAFYDNEDEIPKFYRVTGNRVFNVVAWKAWPAGPRIPEGEKMSDGVIYG